MEYQEKLCKSYEFIENFKIYDLFIPNSYIFRQLCMSYDRTNLFILSIIRIIFLISMYKLINKMAELPPMINVLIQYYIGFNIILLYFIVNKYTFE